MQFKDISYNFSVAKVISILMVVTGHYFGGILGILWIPVTIALFIFAFSSGFFTSVKYFDRFSKKRFWKAKITRLFYNLFVIDVFLLILFLLQKKPGILTWQTLPSILGLSGFLTWLKIGNPSPYGAGLWFFTLLLLFYASYPVLLRINKSRKLAATFLVVFLIITTILNYMLPIGHMLWMTSFAFVFGAYSGVHGIRLTPFFSIALLISSFLLTVYLNIALGYKFLNYFLILAISMAVIGYLLNKRLPTAILGRALLIDGCVLEIYFIHTYLIVRLFTRLPIVDYVFSMITIVIVAYYLNRFASKIRYYTIQRESNC